MTDLREALKRLGFEDFRPGQREALESVLAGRDTLVVMPTGSGKSAIYQLAGRLTRGATVVVSPLIALQVDQLEDLEEREVGEAVAVNSTEGERASRTALRAVQRGEATFALLTPEQLARPERLRQVARGKPSLFVVDEAHCVSEWGQDFRPDYLRLAEAIEELGHPTVLALTATASPWVRSDVIERLGMRRPHVVVTGFDRPSISLEVRTFSDERTKRAALLDAVRAARKPGLVYTATRRAAEEIAAELAEEGVAALAYHAGLGTASRHSRQEAFMDGGVDVMVATVAFGMGIDKPDVGFVFHHSVSDSVDSYYQEVGRAGRDGKPARAILFYRSEELGLRRFQAGHGVPRRDDVRAVLLGQLPSHSRRRRRIEQQLQEVGAGSERLSLDQALERLGALAEKRRNFDLSRAEMMRTYAELRVCRRNFILDYFGDTRDEPCGNCDNCRAGRSSRSPASRRLPFPIGSEVSHKKFGVGSVVRYEADKVVVLFEGAGYRTLSVDLMREQELLRAL